jgi:NAD(P)-dependent dehydrogenase (short-subunit alcohol dehydrogenase family)
MGTTFITGASSGIGRSLARRFAADGDARSFVSTMPPASSSSKRCAKRTKSKSTTNSLTQFGPSSATRF